MEVRYLRKIIECHMFYYKYLIFRLEVNDESISKVTLFLFTDIRTISKYFLFQIYYYHNFFLICFFFLVFVSICIRITMFYEKLHFSFILHQRSFSIHSSTKIYITQNVTEKKGTNTQHKYYTTLIALIFILQFW